VELRDFFEQRVRTAHSLFMSIGLENLLIAGSAIPTEHSAELLASQRVEELFEYIKKWTSSPLILVDLPPIVSPDDALVVAPRLDALILVASEGVTPRADLRKALKLLSGFPIAGLVLNRSTEADQTYGYGYGGYFGST
jgi:Mrp family chromosome partitioning ATPase